MTVYFARAVGLDRIKIGYVQSDATGDLRAVRIARRLDQIGWLYGVQLELVVMTPGLRRLERWFHLRHQASAIGKEWFRLSPELQSDIDVLASGKPVEGQPEPAVYNHTRHYRAWQERDRGDGTSYWLGRTVTPRQLAHALSNLPRVA